MSIILSMASGGCGTGYVAHTLKMLYFKLKRPTIYVQWEPKLYADKNHLHRVNHFNDKEVLESCWQGMYGQMLEWEKVGDRGIYVEISHRHIKGWLYRAAQEIPDLKIINVYRDLNQLARTFYLSRFLRPFPLGNNGWLAPQWNHNLTRLVDLENSTHLQRVIWYIIEIEERKKKFMKDHPHIPVATFSMSDRSLKGWQPILDLLDHEPTEQFLNIVQQDVRFNPWDKKTTAGDHSIADDQIQEAFDNHKFTYNDKEVNI